MSKLNTELLKNLTVLYVEDTLYKAKNEGRNQLILSDKSSEKLIKDKIESSMSFLDKMIRVPISVYELANLDDVTKEMAQVQDYIWLS